MSDDFKYQITLDDIMIMVASNDKRVNEIANRILKEDHKKLIEKMCNGKFDKRLFY